MKKFERLRSLFFSDDFMDRKVANILSRGQSPDTPTLDITSLKCPRPLSCVLTEKTSSREDRLEANNVKTVVQLIAPYSWLSTGKEMDIMRLEGAGPRPEASVSLGRSAWLVSDHMRTAF